MVRYFSVEEANAVIAQVASLFYRLRGIQEELRANEKAMAPALDKGIRGNGHHFHEEGPALVLRKEREELGGRFKEALDEAARLGVEIKDLEKGLADFRTIREGREVYLCWRLGEEAVAYWHDLETGYAGRQPL